MNLQRSLLYFCNYLAWRDDEFSPRRFFPKSIENWHAFLNEITKACQVGLDCRKPVIKPICCPRGWKLYHKNPVTMIALVTQWKTTKAGKKSILKTERKKLKREKKSWRFQKDRTVLYGSVNSFDVFVLLNSSWALPFSLERVFMKNWALMKD